MNIYLIIISLLAKSVMRAASHLSHRPPLRLSLPTSHISSPDSAQYYFMPPLSPPPGQVVVMQQVKSEALNEGREGLEGGGRQVPVQA